MPAETAPKRSRLRRWLKRSAYLVLIASLVSAIFVLSVNYYVKSGNDLLIVRSVEEVPQSNPRPIAIVLGARVWEDGSLSHALYDRVYVGAELYHAGKVGKLLMSGDNPSPEYDEPTAMKRTAMQLGVPESDIVLDFAGRRTYDTCWRAREIFDVRSAVIVSQEFHLARSLYLCRGMGIESTGIAADRRQYISARYWTFRETFSRVSAWLEVNFWPLEPIKGEKEPIQ